MLSNRKSRSFKCGVSCHVSITLMAFLLSLNDPQCCHDEQVLNMHAFLKSCGTMMVVGVLACVLLEV